MWNTNAMMQNPLFMAGMQGMGSATNPNADVGAAWGRGMNSAMQYGQQQQQSERADQQWQWKLDQHERQLKQRAAIQQAFQTPGFKEKLGPYAGLLSQVPSLVDTILPELIKGQMAGPNLAKLNPKDFTPESWAAYAGSGFKDTSQLRAYQAPTKPTNRPTAKDRYGRLVYTDTGEFVVNGEEGGETIPVDAKEALSFRKEARAELAPYREQFESYARVMRALEQDTGAAEIAAIVGFTKFLDPGSVAREGEVALAQSSMGAMNALKAQMERLKSQGGLLSEDAKASIRAAMSTIMEDVKTHYGIRRGKLSEMGTLLQLQPDTTMPATIPWDSAIPAQPVQPQAPQPQPPVAPLPQLPQVQVQALQPFPPVPTQFQRYLQ